MDIAGAQAQLGATSARELAMVMGTVGLAQNFSAIRALATEGIQQGHMTLRSTGSQSDRARVQGHVTLPASVERLERQLIAHALSQTGGNRAETARRLGIHRQLLYRKMAHSRPAPSNDAVPAGEAGGYGLLWVLVAVAIVFALFHPR
eukprot:gene52716-71924_t